MLIALPAFHLFGNLGFRRPLLSHRAMRGFIADTCRIPSALGYEHNKATEVRTVVRPKTTQGAVLWIVCLLQRHLRMTVSNLAHWQYIRNRTGGVGDRRDVGCNVVNWQLEPKENFSIFATWKEFIWIHQFMAVTLNPNLNFGQSCSWTGL
jgi:hypothetical protein